VVGYEDEADYVQVLPSVSFDGNGSASEMSSSDLLLSLCPGLWCVWCYECQSRGEGGFPVGRACVALAVCCCCCCPSPTGLDHIDVREARAGERRCIQLRRPTTERVWVTWPETARRTPRTPTPKHRHGCRGPPSAAPLSQARRQAERGKQASKQASKQGSPRGGTSRPGCTRPFFDTPSPRLLLLLHRHHTILPIGKKPHALGKENERTQAGRKKQMVVLQQKAIRHGQLTNRHAEDYPRSH
jgi:hypothetical protein